MAVVRQIPAYSTAQVEQAVSSYIAQGFMVMNRNPGGVTMFKKKEFSILWAVVGLVLCLLPLLIYLIVYAAQSDQMVEIKLIASQSPEMIAHQNVPDLGSGQVNHVGLRSEDGRWWWDGTTWRPIPAEGVGQP
jgi:hypothetical protein